MCFFFSRFVGLFSIIIFTFLDSYFRFVVCFVVSTVLKVFLKNLKSLGRLNVNHVENILGG